MKVLAIDTSSSMGSIALVEDEFLLGEYSLYVKGTHSEKLLPLIKEVLNNSAVSLNEIDCLGVAIGPGSFTGLRIGLSTVKGIAFSLKKPIIGISSLEALAWNFLYSNFLICPILDARKGELYTAIFTSDIKKINRITEDLAIFPKDLVEKLKNLDNDVIFVGDGILRYKEFLKNELKEKAHFALSHLSASSAFNIALLSSKKFKEGLTSENIHLLKPHYIRPPEAELNRKHQN